MSELILTEAEQKAKEQILGEQSYQPKVESMSVHEKLDHVRQMTWVSRFALSRLLCLEKDLKGARNGEYLAVISRAHKEIEAIAARDAADLLKSVALGGGNQ
jgi:hypothetical protein